MLDNREAELGFIPQKESIHFMLLPNYSAVDKETNRILNEIKQNFSIVICNGNSRGDLRLVINQLYTYTTYYSLKFSKEDHVNFIKLLYEILCLSDLDLRTRACTTVCLTNLLSYPKVLTDQDLCLDWKKLYKIAIEGSDSVFCFVNLDYEDFDRLLMNEYCDNFVKLCNYTACYFDKDCVEEMLSEFLPYLSPFDSRLSEVLRCMNCFLPVHFGYELWLSKVMSFWQICHNNSKFIPVQDTLFTLISKLAEFNIGKIDWSPYSTFLYQVIWKSLNLPVSYKNAGKYVEEKFSQWSCLWIVSTLSKKDLGQRELNIILGALETYCQPSNNGKWFHNAELLIFTLCGYFIKRVKRERGHKFTWIYNIPPSHFITDDEVDEFVNSLFKICKIALFTSRSSLIKQSINLLASLRPNTIIPPILEMYYQASDSLTEPHKHKVCLSTIPTILRPMMEGDLKNELYNDPMQIAQILQTNLLNISLNDFTKTVHALSLISYIGKLLPIWYKNDNVDKAALTGYIEDFLMQFLDTLLRLVDSTINESTDIVNSDIFSKLFALQLNSSTAIDPIGSYLQIMSDEYFEMAVEKIKTYILSTLHQNKSSFMILGVICEVLVKVRPSITLSKLIPTLCDKIKPILSYDIEGAVKCELGYYLNIIESLCKTEYIIEYIDDLVILIDSTIDLADREISDAAARILNEIMLGIGSIKNWWSVSENQNSNICKKSIFVNHAKFNTQQFYIHWYYPETKEVSVVQMLFNRYVTPAINKINSYLNDEDISSESLERVLNVVASLLYSGSLIPFNSESLLTRKSVIGKSSLFISTKHKDLFIKEKLTMPDGSAIRQYFVDLMCKLLKKILEKNEDDTKNLNFILHIFSFVLFPKSRKRKSRFKSNEYIINYFSKRHKYPLQLVVQKSLKSLSNVRETFSLTSLHLTVLQHIKVLTVSRYTDVKLKAIEMVHTMLKYWNNSDLVDIIVDDVIENLSFPTEEDGRFEGAVDVLLKLKMFLGFRQIIKICPKLLSCQLPEKNSALNKFLKIENIFLQMQRTKKFQFLNENCIELAKQFTNDGTCNSNLIEEAYNERYLFFYYKFFQDLLNAVHEKKSHWRILKLSCIIISSQTDLRISFPPIIARYILSLTIHEINYVRQAAMYTCALLLKRQQLRFKKDTRDSRSVMDNLSNNGEIVANNWFKYDSKWNPQCQDDWDNKLFIHDPFIGFGVLPKTIKFLEPVKEHSFPRSFENLNFVEQEIYTFFNNESNVKLIIDFIISDYKSKNVAESLLAYIMFREVFRNFGYSTWLKFQKLLEPLKENSMPEGSHRCLCLFLYSAIKASIYWEFEDINSLWRFIISILPSLICNVTEEDFCYLLVIMLKCSQSIDPHIIHWLYKYLLTVNIDEKERSLIIKRKLFLLKECTKITIWKFDDVNNSLLNMLNQHIPHDFETIRYSVATSLANIFSSNISNEIKLKDENTPNLMAFVENLLPSLMQLTEYNNSLDDKIMYDNNLKTSLNTLKTITIWIHEGSMSFFANHPIIYQFLPVLLHMEELDKTGDIKPLCKISIADLANLSISPENLGSIVDLLETIANSWSRTTRLSCLDFLQTFVFHNLLAIAKSKKLLDRINLSVYKLLEDENIEVRQKASKVLSGFIHCKIADEDMLLINKFKNLCKIDIAVNNKENNVRLKHAGVLGLCSFINAYPYSIPDSIPDIFNVLVNMKNINKEPISSTVKHTINDFLRTHRENWDLVLEKFDEDLLTTFRELSNPLAHYS